jgi:protoheme IX farnesyltransferase
MLPVVAGIRTTRAQVLIYSLPMSAAAIAPWLLGLTGLLYGIAAVAFSALFLGMAARVALSREPDPAKMRAERQLFGYSIFYLFVLFAALVTDRMFA